MLLRLSIPTLWRCDAVILRNSSSSTDLQALQRFSDAPARIWTFLSCSSGARRSSVSRLPIFPTNRLSFPIPGPPPGARGPQNFTHCSCSRDRSPSNSCTAGCAVNLSRSKQYRFRRNVILVVFGQATGANYVSTVDLISSQAINSEFIILSSILNSVLHFHYRFRFFI